MQPIMAMIAKNGETKIQLAIFLMISLYMVQLQAILRVSAQKVHVTLDLAR